MTGKYETELAAIVNADAWAIPRLEDLRAALTTLQDNMKTIASSPGWTGASADSASEMFDTLKKDFAAAETAVLGIHKAIALANVAKATATEAYLALPGVSVPDDVRKAIDSGAATVSVAFLSPVPIAADKVFDMVMDFFGNQREGQANAALKTLQSQLQEPSSSLATQNSALDPTGSQGNAGGSDTKITPDPAPGHVSTPSNTYRVPGGSAGGLGGSTTPPTEIMPGPITDPGWNPEVLPPDPSVDGGLDGGTVPGTGGGSGSGAGGGSGRNGATLTGVGMGIGSGAAAAGIAAASRFGGGLGGAADLGGATPLGSGGLLGSGSRAVSAAAGEGEGVSGTGRGGTSMMGQGGAAGDREKDKRTGLGGIIAPKLEDDEETGPRSTGAMAGGRVPPENKD